MKKITKTIASFLLVFIIFSTGSGLFSTVMANTSFNVESQLFLTAQPSRIVRQHYTTLDAFLFEKETSTPISEKSITFFIQSNGQWNMLGTSQTDETGHAILSTFIDLPQDQYILKATFEGDSTYLLCEDTKKINVIEESMEINFNPIQQYWGKPVELTAYITNPAGNPIPNRNISFEIYVPGNGWTPIPKINVEVITDPSNPGNPQIIWDLQEWVKSDSSGYAAVLYTCPTITGSYDIRISFKGGKYYSIGERIFNNGLTILKRPTLIQGNLDITFRYGDNQQITFNLKDNFGDPVPDASIALYVQMEVAGSLEWVNVATGIANENGLFSADISQSLPFGDFPLKVEYLGTSLYDSLVILGTIHVTRELTLIGIEGTATTYGDPTFIPVYLTDDEGNSILGQPLSLSINYDGINWEMIGNGITDSSGKVDIAYTPNHQSGSYLIKGIYPGSTLYVESEFTTILIIQSERTKIEVSDVSGIIGSNVELEAFLTDDDGNPLAGYELYFYVLEDGNWIPAHDVNNPPITNSIGRATVIWGPISTEEILIKAEFLGDSNYYFGSSGTDHIGPIAISTVLTANPSWNNGKYIIQGELKTSDGTPLIGTQIVINIVNTNFYHIITTTTAADGTYSIEWRPPQPTHYSIVVSYSGSQTYAGKIQTLDESVEWHELIDAWILIGNEEDGSSYNGMVALYITAQVAGIWLMVFAGFGDLWWGAAIATIVAALVGTFSYLMVGGYGASEINMPPDIYLYPYGLHTNLYTFNIVHNAIFGGEGLSITSKEVDKWGSEWGYDSNHQIICSIEQIMLETLTTEVTRAAFIYIGDSWISTNDRLILEGSNNYYFDLTAFVQFNPLAQKLYFIYIDSVPNPKERLSTVVDALYANGVDNVIATGPYAEQKPFMNMITECFFLKQLEMQFSTIKETFDNTDGAFAYSVFLTWAWGVVSWNWAIPELILLIASFWAVFAGLWINLLYPAAHLALVCLLYIVGLWTTFVLVNGILAMDNTLTKFGT